MDSLALDVDLIKLKVMPHDVKESKTLNAIQVRIYTCHCPEPEALE